MIDKPGATSRGTNNKTMVLLARLIHGPEKELASFLIKTFHVEMEFM